MAGKAIIRRTTESAEYLTDERCHILELSNTADDPAASVARARVEPGVTTKKHRVAGTVERYVILEGAGRVSIEGLADQAVGPGDVVVIPAGITQSVTNTGENDLLFLCICTPRFEWDNYKSLE
ncbi:MAG: cupin domain-containing protein [Gammaproteobacteria bacterium]|jgi:mannose-6-phosphate isomerase-like protein (cupin superfamily)|nr:cupin domain-containing protein [Gammaproteobacteria bacterium]MDP6616978.1 cupin domain-containing protein [Gammaproteobacteria bacterium]MDP6695130.1 cupin domain-containing protein [Gammaproteobacteria bacterium]